MSYRLILKRSAEKELLALPKTQAFKVKSAIAELGENPRPQGCKKMSGSADDYRIRIGNYRVIYSVNDVEVTVWVIKIGHRKDVYR